MVRETRHLWVGNLPDNIREDRIRDHFKRYGRVQSVKLLGGRGEKDEVCATVSFMDIKSAAKAHHSEQKLEERVLTTEYHEPAAIPLPNYSRFHLSSEEVSSSFDRSSHFYDRSERGEGAGGYIRRSGYHSTAGDSLPRTRPRDRTYRNGPYTPIIESVVSRSGSSSSHHTGSSRTGGGSWPYESPSPRYPPSTPDISYQDSSINILVHKKHSKSRSGSDSGSNSSRSRSSSASSQSGSSTCSTASSSPASEKSCSTHSQQSTLRSSGVQSGGANHTSSSSPAVHSEDRRPLAICVRNLPARSSDTSLKDGLYHEYKKHGKVTWVKVVGQGVDRYALVSFKKPEDVDKALQVSHDKLFFGCKIEVAPYQGYDVDDNEFRPFEAEQDEFHPKATRTLFIGNLDKDITTQEIRKHFDQFGEIIDIDIKKQGSSSSYAFCQFSDIGSVVRAMRSLDGEHVGGNRVKLGFGKSMHTNCVWVDGVAESVSEKYLSQQFGQFGPVSHVVIDRARGQALVTYEQIQYAQLAVKEMRGVVVRGRKLQVDYASRECQESFYDHMEKQSTPSTHPTFENSSSVASSPQNLRVFESPSSSTTTPCVGSASSVSNRYNSCARYSASRGASVTGTFGRSSSPSSRSSRHSTSRFQDYQSAASTPQDYERRSSYRSYEDVSQAEESSTPTPGPGDMRHLQKERVSLLEQLEDCTSSGEEGTNRRRCNKHRRSQSGEGSRPGTPLCDERPENLGPVEPRRPRESRPPDPLSLPLPRFASQVLSPRPVPPSPPASPQTHSSSSDSEPSPEWEERLRSLDEKYEKWSGSRAGLTKVDPSTVKVRHKLLDLDLHELQPSEIVKSVLAKRSVFDEDSKRLENFGEKYEPREFIPARSSMLRGRLDLSPMSSPVVKSPSSPAAKGLQYPFPSHPPVQPTTSVATTTAPTAVTVTVATTEIKPSATTFLTNCTPTRQFPLPKISSPQAEKCEASLRIVSTKVLPTPTTVAKPIMSCKSQEIKKEQIPNQTKVKSNTPLRRESSDDKKEENRRKSRDESVESVRSIDSVKRDDTSECDKVKDAQITERRKSLCDKRRTSSDVKDLCERTKDFDKRRGSSETESDNSKKIESKKLFDENHMDIPKPSSESDKSRKVLNETVERKKESETNVRHSSDADKKKDVLGVNSEKERRKNRESSDSSDNPKHKKVPDNKKESDSSDKRDKDEEVIRISDNDKKKDSSESCTSQHLNRHKERKDHQDRRRDSSEHSEKKGERTSPENSEVLRIKEKKTHDLTEPRNSKKHHDDSDVKCDTIKHKDSERRKNSENEISKEHSLFKKVFGFAERTYGHHKDRRDSDSTAVKTDDTIKPHKRDHSEKEKKRDKESDHSESSSKHRSRKSPDQPENNRHKERKHSESSEKRSRKEYDLSDDHKQKEDHSENFHTKTRDKKEDRTKESGKNAYSADSEFLPSMGKHRDSDRRKETSLEESRTSETDSNDLKLKDGENKKEIEVFFERRKDESSENKNKDERRKDSEKYFDSEKYNNDRLKKDESESFKDLDKKAELTSDFIKFKHDRHRDNDRKKEIIVENCRSKEHKDDNRQDILKHKEDRKNDDIFDSLKSKDDNFRYREYSRKKEGESQDHIRIKDIIESKKKEEREKKKERESQDLVFKKVRDSDEKNRDSEKTKRKKDFETSEAKMNGDHDDYSLDNVDCRKSNYEEEIRIDPIRKEKRKDRNNTWPATIGCKRRLSSQDCLDIVEDAKRSKPERRDSKDSGRSSGSSRKGSSEKHKGFTKLLEDKIKEDKENEQRKKEDLLLEHNDKNEEKSLKPAIRKEKRNSGEKRKEERKLKNRARENGTASESDLGSGDDETKSSKRQQHSIFDIVDDEPAYISMYDKVKARSTKNMQKQEEEKRQEKLKEKFHQLKASRAKREEKKRSTSYDEDSDSEKGGSRRSNKLLITSSEDDACSESDVRIRSRKILCDTSEDDNVSGPRTTVSKYFDYDSKSSRKIISDISEDDSVIKHSTPKLKSSRSITFEPDQKSRKIMSDTSEDDTTRLNIPRQKPIRITSDDSEGDLGFVSLKTSFAEPTLKITDVFASRPVEMNHFTSNELEQKTHQIQSSPDSMRRISLDSLSSEQPRKKSHKKKQKKKNYEVSEDGTIIPRKHSSKKEKKKSHRDNDDEDKKSRKKKTERESSSNKRDDKFEDIFGPLSDDSEKTLSKWQVSQVYGSDSESERENIRKKEKKRREKKLRELDEAGRALEAKLLDTSEDIIEEPIKTKKKKRKKSRDEKIKHHRVSVEESATPVISKSDSKPDIKQTESEETKDSEVEIKIDTDDNEREDDDDENKMEIDYDKQHHKEEPPVPVARLHSSSLSSLLDSPPAPPVQHKKPDIPGFGSEVDENIHETAVKSISESTLEEQGSISKEKYEEKSKPEDQPPPEEKAAPVISQEETEDAVAALLMEDTFASGFERYSEETPKPDTPVSEPDLQIDTDTEDNFDHNEFVKTPRVPEVPNPCFIQSDTREGLEERIMPLACSAEANIKKETEKPIEVEPPIIPKVEPASPKHEKTETFEGSMKLPLDSEKPLLNVEDIKKEKEEEIETVIIKDDSQDEKIDVPTPSEEEKKNNIKVTYLTIDEESNPPPSPKVEVPAPEPVAKIKEEPKEVVTVKVEEDDDVIEVKEIKTAIPKPSEDTVSQSESKDLTVNIPRETKINIKQEKTPEPAATNSNSSVVQNFQKAEKVIHHQAIPATHSTLLVHQAVQQPQTAQVVKPLALQVINPPALKPLEPPATLKANPGPPVSLNLSSPPVTQPTTTTHGPSFSQISQPSNQTATPKPQHTTSPFHQVNKLPSPIPHLVPPHIPVKPTSQMSLQAPQLTPISKGNLVPPPRPVIVHSIQNHSSQKQLQVVTTNPQLSPQPLSPQNLKVIRPTQPSGMNVRPSLAQTPGMNNRPPSALQTPVMNLRPPCLPQTAGMNIRAPVSPQAAGVNIRQPSSPQTPGVNIRQPSLPQSPGMSIRPPSLPPTTGMNVRSPSSPQTPGMNIRPSSSSQSPGANIRQPCSPQTPVMNVRLPSPPQGPGLSIRPPSSPQTPVLNVKPPSSPQTPGMNLRPPSSPQTAGMNVRPPPSQLTPVMNIRPPTSPQTHGMNIRPLPSQVHGMNTRAPSLPQSPGLNIRPLSSPGISIRPLPSPLPVGNRPSPVTCSGVPLVQAVGVNKPSHNELSTVCPPRNDSTAKVVQFPKNKEIPHPPITHTPDTPLIKTEPKSPKSTEEENDIKPEVKPADNVKTETLQESLIQKPPVPLLPGAAPVTKPTIQINSVEDTCNETKVISIKKEDESFPVRQSVFEPKLIKPSFDEPKPLNAVIQDLTLRAANKALAKTPTSLSTVEMKSESSKPIEQVVRELQLRKKAASLSSEPEKCDFPIPDKRPIDDDIITIEEDKPEEETEIKTKKVDKTDLEAPKEMLEDPPKPSQPPSVVKTPLEIKETEEKQVKVEHVEESKIEAPQEKQILKENLGEKLKKDATEKTPPPNNNKNETKATPETPEPQTPKSQTEPEFPSSEERVTPEKNTPVISSGRGRGGRTRGKRGRGGGNIATRRGARHTAPTISHPAPARPQAPADVYEFRDDSEEERPRLILTIKPDPPPQQPSHQGPSTRKSRRLQEKDGSRTTVEDTIEDVIRCSGRPGRRATRSTAPLLSLPTVETTRKSPRRKQAQSHAAASEERSPTPQPAPTQPAPIQSAPTQPSASPQPAPCPAAPSPAAPSPAAPSPAAPSPVAPSPAAPSPAAPSPAAPSPAAPSPAAPSPALAKPPASQTLPIEPPTQAQIPQAKTQTQPSQQQKEPPALKEVIQPEKELPLVRELPTKLPKEEVKLPPQQKEPISLQTIPVLREVPHPTPLQPVQTVPQKPPLPKPSPPISASQPLLHPQPPAVKLPLKLQSSFFNKGDLKPLLPQRTGNPGEPTTLIDPVTGLLIPMREGEEGQYIPVGGDGGEPPPEKRPRLEEGMAKAPVATVRPSVVRPPQQHAPTISKPTSPPHLPQKPVVNSSVPRPPKAHLLQAVAAERAKIIPPPRPKLIPPQTQPIQAPKPPTPLTPKAHILQAMGNAQAREGIIGSPAPHQGSILTGSVASPPLRAHPQPIVTGASSARYGMKGHEAPSRGSEGGCIVVPTPSPQPPTRGQVLQAGLPVPAYEASLGDVVQHVNYPGHHIQPAHYVHPQLMYQQYLREAALGPSPYHRAPGGVKEAEEVVRSSPPLELRRRASPHDRTTDSPQVATVYGRPHLYPPPAHRPAPSSRHQVSTPPHASQVPPQADSLLVLLQRYPVMWQGLLALKNDQAAVQMHFVFGNPHVARDSLPCNSDGSTPPLRISQRMRLEQTQLDGVARKMQMDNEHCMLLALPCGRDHMDVLQQSNNLQSGFITYLQQKQAAGIVNIAAPGSQQAAYVVHIFPASEFANDSLARIAPDLLHRVTDIAHLLIVIATV